ncbi:hypothetical protein K7569_14665 [Stenotrophomonas maltophilia]|nr:hypothetical protein K7569_14665 [Stenotrophomonas maltophilia]
MPAVFHAAGAMNAPPEGDQFVIGSQGEQIHLLIASRAITLQSKHRFQCLMHKFHRMVCAGDSRGALLAVLVTKSAKLKIERVRSDVSDHIGDPTRHEGRSTRTRAEG